MLGREVRFFSAPAAACATALAGSVGTAPHALAGRSVAGLSAGALARVRAAVAAANEGMSPEEAARAALLHIMRDATPHPDALPPRAPQPPPDYGDGL